MRKLMKKKVNVFGKGVPVLAIFILGIALVSAALVPYLSNAITGNVVVDSPMVQEIGLVGETLGPGPLTLESMRGGESQTFVMQTTNLATDPITGDVMNLVSSEPVDGIDVSCADFTLEAYTNNVGPYYPTCTEINTTTLRIHYGPADVITWGGLQVDTTKVTVTFEVNAVGTYEFSSQVMDI